MDPVIGSEQFGPVLVIQNDIGNHFSLTLIVAAITSRLDNKPKLPTHCLIHSGTTLKQPSVVLLEQLRTIDKKRLDGFIGRLDAVYMNEVEQALAISLGLQTGNE